MHFALFNKFDNRFVGGDRPYWWVHIAHPMENISVDRFDVECDSTPGKTMIGTTSVLVHRHLL